LTLRAGHPAARRLATRHTLLSVASRVLSLTIPLRGLTTLAIVAAPSEERGAAMSDEVQRPTNDEDREGWKTYWTAQGMA